MSQTALEPQSPSAPGTRPPIGARARNSGGLAKKTASISNSLAAEMSIGAAAHRSRLATFFLEFSPVDWIITFFFSVLTLAVLMGRGPHRDGSLELVALDWTVFAAGLSLSRGGILAKGGFASTLLYRLTIFGTIVSSYFELRVILPTVSTRAVDGSLFAFDMRMFHVEPSLAWDKFVTPQTTEWFAFFYFGYFFLLAIHSIPFALFVKSTDLIARFALGITIVFCVGHMTYMLVPGYGPYSYLTNEFHHELTGGFFWGLVQEAVAAGGAQKDIFPSLHTAVPTFFALFSFRYRRELPILRFTWPIVAFCATQIICATMFLRWHYLIDILAGLSLATAADALSARLVPWDERRRAARGLSPAWSPLLLPWSWRQSRSPENRLPTRR
jgi:hypothetical protein